MRHTSEIFKVVKDEDDVEQQMSEIEEEKRGSFAIEGKERITIPLPSDSQALEPHSFSHIQPLVRTVRETELSLIRLDPHLVTLQEIDREAASNYNKLAISLIAGAAKRPPLKRVLMASAHHLEGRTCVTLNLAAALARAKQRVLVIDTDLLRPSVSRLLGIDAEIGLSEVLSEGLCPELAVIRVLPINFDIIPTRHQVDNAAELLASNDFKMLVASLEANYDFILFDSAPLLSCADASLLVLETHATLMVVRPGTTTSAQMKKAVTYLNQESLFGVVLNRLK